MDLIFFYKKFSENFRLPTDVKGNRKFQKYNGISIARIVAKMIQPDHIICICRAVLFQG